MQLLFRLHVLQLQVHVLMLHVLHVQLLQVQGLMRKILQVHMHFQRIQHHITCNSAFQKRTHKRLHGAYIKTTFFNACSVLHCTCYCCLGCKCSAASASADDASAADI